MSNRRYIDRELRDGQTVAAVLRDAAAASLGCASRKGSVVELEAGRRLVVSGDLHDHTQNFERLVRLADLDGGADHHLVLHEVIHGPHRVNGMDLSCRMMAKVAALKVAYPEQVHVLLSNHELTQRQGGRLLKHAEDVIVAFDEGVAFLYHDAEDAVREAVREYVGAMVLAVRTAGGVMVSHSLPAARKMDDFDLTVVDRKLTEADLATRGAAHLMVWGRHQTDEQLDALAAAWGVTTFVCGHQAAEGGRDHFRERMVLLASDDDYGSAVVIETGAGYDAAEVMGDVIYLAEVGESWGAS